MSARIGGVVVVVGALVACGGSTDGGDLGPMSDSGVDTGASPGVDASGSVDGAEGAPDSNGGVDASDGAVSTPDASDAASASPDASDGSSTPDASDSGIDATLSPDAGPPRVCVPGESIGCVGLGGCLSNQVCNDDGTAYGACQCASEGGAVLACVPGQSIACGGPGGCTGYQVCDGAGSAYGECLCPDAGSVGGTDASVGWTPAQLPGLALWLDASYGVLPDPVHAGFLIRWLDKSGNENNATLGGAFDDLVYFAPYVDPQVLNGHNAVACQP
jgi:hypothetical protein